MTVDQTKEKELIYKAKSGDFEDLINYLHNDINDLSESFSKTKRGIELEIPVTSLNKAAEKHLKDAVSKYSDLIESNSEVTLGGFSSFYKWFAEQGINEYSHQWEMLLNGGLHSGPCCH